MATRRKHFLYGSDIYIINRGTSYSKFWRFNLVSSKSKIVYTSMLQSLFIHTVNHFLPQT